MEFGSDFNSIGTFMSGSNHLPDIYSNAVFLANGRQCLDVLVAREKWNRMWLPEYFCYEVVDYLRSIPGLELAFYHDYPGCDDEEAVRALDFREGDVLLRVNYFGMRNWRSKEGIPVPVIEDHTHDLIGSWASGSDADWCIASLRKTLPLPEGGMLWSPKGNDIGHVPASTELNEAVASERWSAMDLKTRFLDGEDVSKEEFRKIYIGTEDEVGKMPVCALDSRSLGFLADFDIKAWYEAKQLNIKALAGHLAGRIRPLGPEGEGCNMFSFAMNVEDRAAVKARLVGKSVYPAILWELPDSVEGPAAEFSGTMLSVHCDGRYSEDDMAEMSNRIKSCI